MRGFIQGSLWALVLGGIGVSTVSYLDDQGKLGLGGPLAPAATAPDVMLADPMLGAAPAFGDLPRMPFDARAPFIDPFVPRLTNIALLPAMPVIDDASTPLPIQAIVDTPELPENDQEQPAAVVDVPAPEADTATVAEPLPQVDTQEAPVETVDSAPQIVEPDEDGAQVAAETTEDSSTGVVINRLGTSPTEPAGESAEVVVATDADEVVPALRRYAAPFENPDDLPLLAIVLIDGGAGSGDAAAVAALDFPVTVVVNALAPDAAAQLQAYRAAGAEVAMELALPQGALPADVEVAFEAAIALMDEAAMLYSSGNDAVQSSRQVTTQVMQVLAANGMGFVAEERGLGGAIRVAQQAAVPAAAIGRDLDGGRESADAIARALDQAAFRARQSGDTVLMARLNATTLGVLRDWAAANQGAGTAIGPVSALMLSAQE